MKYQSMLSPEQRVILGLLGLLSEEELIRLLWRANRQKDPLLASVLQAEYERRNFSFG